MSIKKHFRLSRGFTLVELLVVIAIIGVLATLLLLQLGVARGKARDVKRIADVNQLRTTIELYFDDNGGHYPAALTIANLGKYLTAAALPKDPVTTIDYFYAWTPNVNPASFHIYAELEQKATAALVADSDLDSTGWSGDALNASVVATEACAASYAAGAARDCVYDQGQK